MSENLERRLSERLHAHPVTDELPGLAARSVQRAHAIRRRRLAGVVGALLLLLILPRTAQVLLDGRSDSPPATTVPGPTATAPAASPRGTRVVIIDPVGRLYRGEPTVPTVRDGSYWPVTGPAVQLPDGQLGSVTTYDGGPVWLTRDSAGRLALNLAGPLPVATEGRGVTGAEPGPAGSVMVRTGAGPVLWSRLGGYVTPAWPALRTQAVAATADALWAVQDGRVLRFPVGDVTAVGNGRRLAGRWQRVLLGDPRADRVVVADRDGCQAVLDGTTGEPLYESCDIELSVFSADGARAAGHNTATGLLAVVDLAGDRLLLALDPENNPVGPRMVLEDAGVLNLRVGNEQTGFALLVCDLTADCWFTSHPYPRPLDYVLANRS